METEDTTRAAARPTALAKLVPALVLLVGLVVFGWAAPATYDVYKLVHVLAALVWVGGGTMLVVLVLLTERENDPVALAALGKKAEFAGTRIFTPAGLVVVLFGVLMMMNGDLDWGQFWVIAGLVGFGLSFVTGAAFLGPQVKQLNELADRHGVEHPITQAKLRTILAVARFDVAMLLLVVADMVAKPFS